MALDVGIEIHIDWEAAYTRHGNELKRCEKVLQELEYEHGFQLTPGAVEMMFVPLIEALDSEEIKPTTSVVDATLSKVMQTMKENPDGRDPAKGLRSSWSVIKADCH